MEASAPHDRPTIGTARCRVPPFPTGPARVRFLRCWAERVAEDVLRVARELDEEGWGEEAIHDIVGAHAEYLCARTLEAIEMARDVWASTR